MSTDDPHRPPSEPPAAAALSRRRLLKLLSAGGVGTAVFHRALAARAAEAGGVTSAMIREAE
ncbi:MAG: hypothetical protein KDA41_11875, partial [Planctomycetales bacterium]|nr:hypothetical protein [Planctomycetales bacterium]